MPPLRHLRYLCYILLPIISITLVVGISLIIAGALDFYHSNLTTVQTLESVNKFSPVNYLVTKPPFPSDKPNNYFTFLQISDLHISKFRDYGQVKDLQMFCDSKILQEINPALVLLTGDLTDAKDRSLISSEQYKEEWVQYSNLINYCKQSLKKTTFLDIKGNHDSFKVTSEEDPANYYVKYSESKDSYNNTGVLQYEHKEAYGIYEFIGVDLTPQPGPGRPFNFFGVPRKQTLDHLMKLSVEHKHFINGTIWFGHYPLSVTTQPTQLRNLLSKRESFRYVQSAVAYLCGHLHTMLEHVPRMHAVHQDEGLLELELGDWKQSRRIRISAFDHDIFSFIDMKYPLTQPAVLFTNPTDAHYLLPLKNPTMKARNSTHIRFLVYWNKEVSTIQVYINNQIVCDRAVTTNGNLYTCKWNPLQYTDSLHILKVVILDNINEEFTSSIQFSLDGERPPLSFFSVVLLVTNFITIIKAIYIVCVFFATIFLYMMKFYAGRNSYLGLIRDLFRVTVPQVNAFLESDSVFWPLFYYNCYISIGPFSVGYFLADKIGVAFPFGIYTDGHFVDGSLTYIYVAEQMVALNVVMIFYLGEHLNKSTSDISFHTICTTRKLYDKLKAICFQVALVLFIIYQLLHVWSYYMAYGYLSAIINPLKMFSLPLIYYLIMQV